MDTNLVKKLSTQVVNQLPEFLRVDISDPTSSSPYQTFVAFIQAYYEFLEQNGEAQYVIQNARSYADIDETIDTFVDKFLQEFAYDLPKTIFSDQTFRVLFSDVNQIESKRAVAKRISQIYATKGSEAAIRLLFRLLFDDEITFYYPKEDMLRASDGRWIERKTLKVYVPGGNVDLTSFGANLITGLSSSSTAVVDRVTNLGFEVPGKDIFELQLESDTILGTFQGNETVQFSVGNLTTGNVEITGTAVVVNVITGFDIVDPGYGYTVGTEFNVSGTGNSFSGSVGAVNDGGKIQRISVANFGAEYSTATANISIPSTVKNGKYTLESNVITAVLIDNTGNSLNHGLAANDTINVSFTSNLSSSYNGVYKVISVPSSKKFRFGLSNANVITGNLSLNSKQANLVPTIGTLCNYYGFYTGKEGQPDERIKIQDSYFYQDYSYVIRTTQASIFWRELVKKILHPAGMELFAEVLIIILPEEAPSVYAGITNVYETFITLLKLLSDTPSVKIPSGVSTKVVLSIYEQASRDSRYRIGPTFGTLEDFKFVYDNLQVKDVEDIVIGTVIETPYLPHNIPPPSYISIETVSVNPTWNPADKTTNITLSNGNVTAAANSGSTFEMVRSTYNTLNTTTGGKYYWEISVDTLDDANDIYVGLKRTTDTITSNLTPLGGAYALWRGSGFYYSGGGWTPGSSPASYAAGNVLMFALDIDNRKLFMGKDGTWNNSGDPVAGTNASFTTMPIGEDYAPIVSTDNIPGAIEATLITSSSSFNFTPPSGFTQLPTP